MTRRDLARLALAFAAGAAIPWAIAQHAPGDRQPEAPGDRWRLVILWDDGESDIADSGMTWADCHGRISEFSPDIRAREVFCEPDDMPGNSTN